MLVQLDDFANERGQYLGQTLSVAPGLSFILPASGSFRRPARMKELTETCTKCRCRLRTWAPRRFVTDHTTPRINYIECRCMLLAVESERYEVTRVTGR
jgi:hypothetical protein